MRKFQVLLREDFGGLSIVTVRCNVLTVVSRTEGMHQNTEDVVVDADGVQLSFREVVRIVVDALIKKGEYEADNRKDVEDR